MDARAAQALLAQPRSGDRGKVRLHGDDGAVLWDADQRRKLGEDLAGAADDGHPVDGARKEPRRRRSHRVEEARLVLVGHAAVAVTRSVVDEPVHGLHRGLADQAQRRLVQVAVRIQRGEVPAVNQGRNHCPSIQASRALHHTILPMDMTLRMETLAAEAALQHLAILHLAEHHAHGRAARRRIHRPWRMRAP